MVFWYDKETSDFLVAGGVSNVTYYFDGAIVGSQEANVYWTGAPACGQNGSVTVSKDLGPVKSKMYEYKVVSNSGVTIWSGTKYLDDNVCIKLQLTK